MAIDLDFIKETPLWEFLRGLVAKIPTSAYYVIGLILAAGQVVIQAPALFGIDPVAKWFQVSSAIFSLLVLLFTRPKSPIDSALDEAAQAKTSGNELKASRIAEKVVDVKAERLAKK